MTRWFNTAGPCNPVEHYMLPAMARLPEVAQLVERSGYFVVHAPRQVGKTTALLSLAQRLTAEGRYLAVLVSMEMGAGHPDDVGAAEQAILNSWRHAAAAQLPAELQPPEFPETAPGSRIASALAAWAVASPRPLVVFLDEIDALRDDVLISVLRQLRDGYRNRPHRFPASLALIGLRDVRDYNIAVRSLSLRNFSVDEVAELYGQHTVETGQHFEPAATSRAFELSQGQPWLINSLAKISVELIGPTKPISFAHIERSRQILVERQEPHFADLTQRMRDPRILAILEPMLAGRLLGDVPEDDRRFAVDLGLLRRNAEGRLEVTNTIYREIILRSLGSNAAAVSEL
jgi:AAA domain